MRSARPEDVPGCVALQAEVWGSTARASAAQLRRRLELHPHGFFVAVDRQRICGSLTTIRLESYCFDDPPSWYAATLSGWGDTHAPSGAILYGVDLSVARWAPRESARQLVEATLAYAVRENLRYVVAGLRIARFSRWAHRMTAEEYVAARRPSGSPLDPLLARVLHYPSVKMVKVVPRHFSDADSHDFGVVVRWENPHYQALHTGST